MHRRHTVSLNGAMISGCSVPVCARPATWAKAKDMQFWVVGSFWDFCMFWQKNTIGPNRTLMFPIDSACHVFAAKESSSVLGVWFQVLMNYDMLCFSPWASCCPALVLSNWFWPIIRLKSFSNTAALNNSNDFNAGLHREDWIAADFLTKTRKHKEQVPSIHCGTLGFDWIRLHLN
jgi:hypothetical protein